MSFRLDRRGLRNWLLQHDPDEIVGQADLQLECPFACYIREEKGVSSPMVSDTQVRWFTGVNDYHERDLSDWAFHFVNRVDELAASKGLRAITAAEALIVLDVIEQEVA